MQRANATGTLCAGVLLVLTSAGELRAQSYEGVWRAGVTTMDVAVESWGGDCGPRPVSSRSEGGGNVQVTEEPPHLIIHGKESQIRTDRCWSRNPAIRRRSSSYLDGVWLTQCRTDPDDPRAEQGTYSLKAVSPNQLLYKDISKYNWKLNASACVATITTTQTLNRVATGANQKPVAPPPKAPAPPPLPPPEPDEEEEPAAGGATACVPGAPAKLVLRPQRAELQVGGRLCLRPRLTDKEGCPIPKPALEWSLQHSRALRGTLEGPCFRAGDSAAEAEGEFTVTASHGGLSARSVIDVRSVDLSALIARRMETGAVSGFDSAPAEASTATAAKVATRRVDERSGQGAGDLLLIIGALVVAGLVVLIVLRMRGRSAGIAESERAAEPSRDDTPARPQAPRVPGSANAPSQGPTPTLVAAPASTPDTQPETAPAAGSEQWICPSCRRGWPAAQRTCPTDGATLMPYAEFVKARDPAQQRADKRCPKCGKLYPPGAGFCSEDGTRLS